MGRIFKTPKDDSVEETLRAMHLANTVDNVYEWGIGWVRTVIAFTIGVLGTSALEYYTNIGVWELTGEWAASKVEETGQWLLGLVS
jgi:hypothetical protein|tara:strand:- start:1674 stop:1931 length:258 start_codon:yes stop_codon:yes gene_type:complete